MNLSFQNFRLLSVVNKIKEIKEYSNPVRQLLDERGWTGEHLADITGFARTHLSSVMSGKVGISPDMAVALAAAFGNEPADWLRWNAEYQLYNYGSAHT